MKDIKLITCPSCLGSKEVFNPLDDIMVKCNFCKGKGEVSEDKADLYDPVGYELGISSDSYIIGLDPYEEENE